MPWSTYLFSLFEMPQGALERQRTGPLAVVGKFFALGPTQEVRKGISVQDFGRQHPVDAQDFLYLRLLPQLMSGAC